MNVNSEIAEQATPKKLKTIANCNSRDFAVQTAKISRKLKNYSQKIKEFKNGLTGENDGEKFSVALETLSFICDGNIDETMELCGSFCFMTGEEFANLDPSQGDPDGITAVVEVFNSERCLSFFSTAMQISRLTGVL